MTDLEKQLIDTLLSIASHDEEFSSIEDAETMVFRITEKAKHALEPINSLI